jgi:hypothetical protein
LAETPGFAAIVEREVPRFRATPYHLNALGKIMLVGSLMLGYAYVWEAWGPYYGSDVAERTMFTARVFGRYAPTFWPTVALNIAIPQLLWLPAVRRSEILLFAISAGIIVGMWLERFVIVVTSLHRNYMRSPPAARCRGRTAAPRRARRRNRAYRPPAHGSRGCELLRRRGYRLGRGEDADNPYGRASLIATSSSRRFRAFRPSIGLFLTLFFLILRFVPIVFSGGLAAR